MAVRISTQASTGNFALGNESAETVARIARQNLIAEFDMLTYDSGNPKRLLDQSGNGNDAFFLNNPTVGATGVTFDSVNYADVTTIPLMTDDFAFFLVAKSTLSGFYVMGNRNETTPTGVGFRLSSPPVFPHGHGAFTARLPAALFSAAKWSGVMCSYENQYYRAKNIVVQGRGDQASISNTRVAYPITRTRWRIGAITQTVGGDDTTVYLPASSATTLAYCGIFSKARTLNQEAALAVYLAAKLAPRGITMATS